MNNKVQDMLEYMYTKKEGIDLSPRYKAMQRWYTSRLDLQVRAECIQLTLDALEEVRHNPEKLKETHNLIELLRRDSDMLSRLVMGLPERDRQDVSGAV